MRKLRLIRYYLIERPREILFDYVYPGVFQGEIFTGLGANPTRVEYLIAGVVVLWRGCFDRREFGNPSAATDRRVGRKWIRSNETVCFNRRPSISNRRRGARRRRK